MTVFAYALGATVTLVAVLARWTTAEAVLPFATVATIWAMTAAGVSMLNQRRLQLALQKIRGARPVAATGLIEAPPIKVAELFGRLRPLGFEIAGVTDTTLSGGEPIRTWILTGREGTTWVEVGLPDDPLAIFLSEGADRRHLETVFPRGEQIDDPKLLARAVGAGVAEAFAAHQETLAEWTARRGAPRRVRSLDDYLEAEAVQRERTGGMRIATHLERVVRPAVRAWLICAAIAIVATAALLFLGPRAPG
jgi:hypothetical protein